MALSPRTAESSDAERLRRVESVTDAALSHLGLEDLLLTLLARLRDLLGADTAAVLLLDRKTGDLVATAALGIEAEVREGTRVPLGQGFAGRVAAEQEPVVVDDVAHADLYNSLLRTLGIKALVGVPLVTESRVIGVLHVGSLQAHHFGTDDVELLQMVADRVALAVEARRSNAERAAATALQRSLIPAHLPDIPGLDLAGRYLPADAGGVGGDWYDVFVLPSGRVGLVIGDVIGRGLGAAVVMGRLRSALRAYALDSSAPDEVIDRLDRKLQHFEPGQMTTVLYAVLDPSYSSLELSSAGHPLPMLAAPGVGTVTVEARVDPPLGVTIGRPRHRTTVELDPGDVLCFFTDGLVERRGESIDEGLARLRAALRAGPAHDACAGALAALVGTAELADDAALLVVRRDDEPAGEPLHLTLPAVPASLARVRGAFRRWLAGLGVGEARARDILLAVGEATTNAVEHAYGPAGGDMTVDASADGTGDEPTIVVTVRDTGRWRPPRGRNRGRGLRIMERCADEVTTDRTGTGTELRLVFRSPGDGT